MSLFDLPGSSAELRSANEGTSNARYQQITATRNVGPGSFGSGGVIQYRWDSGGNTWFIPCKSYFRIRATILQVRTDGQPPQPLLCQGDIAPAMGFAAHLFKTVEIIVDGNTVERVGERLPQIDALRTRKGKSKAWMDSLGKSTNFWDYDHESRKQRVCQDGFMVDRVGTYPPTVVRSIAANQEEAGFSAVTTMAYSEGIVSFVGAGVDILIGKMALRTGDALKHNDGSEYRIIAVLSAVTCSVQVLNIAVNIAAGAAVGFEVSKVENSSRNDTLGKSSFEIIWQPPMGFFQIDHAIPPGGTWTIELDPENVTQFQQNSVESTGAAGLNVAPTITANTKANDFTVTIDQMYFYIAQLDSSRFENGSYFLDIENMRCQQENMNGDSTGLVQKNFDVSGKTNALTLAFQDQSAGTSTLFSRSLFKIRPGAKAPNGGLGSARGQDLNLVRFYLAYNNTNKPSPDYDGQYQQSEGDTFQLEKNHLTQRYVDTMMNNGGYHAEGGVETIEEWINRGPYYHFLWPKDAMQPATRVNLNFQFSAPFDGNLNHKVLLFATWRTAFHIVHINGRIDKMTSEAL